MGAACEEPQAPVPITAATTSAYAVSFMISCCSFFCRNAGNLAQKITQLIPEPVDMDQPCFRGGLLSRGSRMSFWIYAATLDLWMEYCDPS